MKRKILFMFICVILLILILLYSGYSMRVDMQNHYDVKRGTLLWYIVMFDKTIRNFPIINPDGKPVYDSYGDSTPTMVRRWILEYTSKQPVIILSKQIIQYLEKEGYRINEVDELLTYHTIPVKTNESYQLFKGIGLKNERYVSLVFETLDNGYTKIIVIVDY